MRAQLNTGTRVYNYIRKLAMNVNERMLFQIAQIFSKRCKNVQIQCLQQEKLRRDGILGRYCQGVDYLLNYSILLILANRFKNPIKLALFTIFMYFSCISDRNWLILHKFH